MVMEMADPPAIVNRLGVNATEGTCPSPALASSVADIHIFWDDTDSVSSTLVTKDLCMCSVGTCSLGLCYIFICPKGFQ